MDLLRPWIAATIEEELNEALKSQDDGTRRQQQAYDDGSNLRIPSAKKGQVVQITKFLTFEEPIQVTLSDSVIRVNASIANQASQQYVKKNKKKLTEGTVGGLIQLEEFEIVATHLGPRDKRLTLYVKNFKTLGADGSGNFGVAPQAIESRDETKELLTKLAHLRRQKSDTHFKQSAKTSPIASQSSGHDIELENGEESQTGFATQISRSNVPKASKLKPRYPSAGVNISSPSAANHDKSSASLMGNGSNLSKRMLRPVQMQTAPQASSTSDTQKALLSLLQNHNRGPPTPEIVPRPPAKQPLDRTATAIGSIVTETALEASRDLSLTASDNDAGKAPIRNRKRKRHLSDTPPTRNGSDDLTLHGEEEAKKVADDHDVLVIETERESLVVNGELADKARLGAAVDEASTKIRHGRLSGPSLSDVAPPHAGAPSEPSVQPTAKLTSPTPSQKGGRTRISTRDVRIRKDQETLLNRADSWLPAEPGQREPTAHIPISLLKKLNQKASFPAQQSPKKRNQGDSTRTPSVTADHTADSESDVPVSSGQWPASPEREQLPPDSSPPSVEHIDHSASRISHDPHSLSSSRTHSNASFSSNSMQLGRLSSKAPWRLSVDPGSSPRHPSTILTFTSAAEEFHRFKCQVPDCGKSYKDSGGLKSHVDLVHPSTERPENFKCAVKGCTESYSTPEILHHHVEHHHDGNAALLGRNASGTPPSTGPSTPFSAGRKFWSEHEKRSEETAIEKGANVDLDNAEAAVSMPPLIYSGPEASKDEVTVVRQSLSASSLQQSDLLSDAQPTPDRSSIDPADETLTAKENLSPLLPASPTPESDIEMTVPLALVEKTDSVASSAPMKRFPSTASQPQDPFTQVKRTPYVNGRVQIEEPSEQQNHSSPTKATLDPLMNGAIYDDVDFVSASVASAPETSTAETYGDSESKSQSIIDNNLKKKKEIIADDHHELREAEAGKADDPSTAEAETRSQNLGLESLSVVAEPNAQIKIIPEMMPAPENDRKAHQLQITTADNTGKVAYEMKRKAEDSSSVSPNVAKRRRFKIPSVFTFSERPGLARDPSEGARQHRQDFLASRRSSENSTPTMSPTIPLTVFPATSPHIPRDPLEGARQIRQDFLASRKSSESSTAMASPQMIFTSLTETAQADGRSVEVEDNIEEGIVQNRLADTEIEREKMTELETLSPKSQIQEEESDAVPLPNGTIPIETDGDDARSGAQDTIIPDHEADPLVFATQIIGSKSHNPEQNIAIGESFHVSNDEVQRAQSVEFDASFQLPDTQQVERDFTNVNDVDRIVDPGEASTNIVENDEAVGTGPVESRKDTSTRSDEEAEQGSNMPTLQITRTVTSGSLMPDKDSIEPMSEQPLLGKDTDTLMSNTQIDQDSRHLEPVVHMEKSINQFTHPPLPIPAFITESDTGDRLQASTAATEPDLAQSVSTSDPETKSVGVYQNGTQLPTEPLQLSPNLIPQNIFDKFREAYPTYPGDLKHFVAICRKIDQLLKANRIMHQSLWDDFIVRHKTDYSQYLGRCAEEAEDAIPFEKFYETEIEGPQYQKRVIHRRNLDEVLALVAQKVDVRPMEHVSTYAPDTCTGNPHPERELANEVEPFEPDGTHFVPKTADSDRGARKSPVSPVTIDLSIERETIRGELEGKSAFEKKFTIEAVQRPSKERVIIDLTEDEVSEDRPKRTEGGGTSSQSSLPRLHPEYRRDSSGSLDQSRYSSSTTRGSYMLPLPQSDVSHATAPTKSTTKTNRRSLPWKESDCNILQTSSSANVNDHQRVIQANWGIRAHELLEQECYGCQALSENMIELIAKIASKVDIREARNRIKEAIETRIRGNTQSGAGHSSRDRKVLKSDLEVVSDIVGTSSMSTTSPFSLLHTNAAVEKREEERRPCDWWDDANSPFKSFVRAYTSIRHGKGNSYATADQAEPRDAGKVSEAANSGIQLKKIDFLGWNL